MRGALRSLRSSWRSLPLGAVAGVSALSAAPTVFTVARGGEDLSLALAASALIGGAGLAYAVDDDAQAVLASSPTPLWARRAVRLGLVLGIVAVGWACTAGFGAAAGLLGGVPSSDLGVEGLTASGVAVAVAAWAYRHMGMDRPGMAGAVAGVLSVLVISALAVRFPGLPSIRPGVNHNRWLWLTAGSWTLAVWTTRDPASRRLR